jgi:hypothetical protein
VTAGFGPAEDLQRELDVTRRELDELGEDIALAEARMADFARQDLQLGDLRGMLEEARARHTRMLERERALRARFDPVLSGKTSGTH